MKILVPTAGPVPAKEKAEYIANIAKRLGAELIAMHVLKEEEQAEKGEEALNLFSDAGQNAQVSVTKVLKKGDIVSAIIESAEEESADLIVMGASRGKVVAEWVSADVMTKTTIPVVVIPHELKRL
jgi:nucleotide-binding universal stress UspA family protein